MLFRSRVLFRSEEVRVVSMGYDQKSGKGLDGILVVVHIGVEEGMVQMVE